MLYAVPSSSLGAATGSTSGNPCGGGIMHLVRRGLKRALGYFALMCSDSFVQLMSILVIVIIMTGEGMRASIEADEATPMTLPPLRNQNTNANINSNSNNTSSFQGFRGVRDSGGDLGGDDVQRFTFMLYRLIKGMSISSVVDTPCGASLGWLPPLVRQLEFEIPRFRYHCVLHTRATYAAAVAARSKETSALHLVYSGKKKQVIPAADLALLWHAFGYLEPAHAWGLLRDLDVRYVIVPNYPNVKRNAGHGNRNGRVNVRRSPYRFGEPIRIIQDVHRNGTEVKQMLLYEVSTMKRTSPSTRSSTGKISSGTKTIQ